MEKPVGPAGCPPGLEYLTQVDQLLVHQVVELFEAFTGWETNNRFAIKNSMGQQVYFAAEQTDMCMRQCCGPHRGFEVHVADNSQQEVMLIRREFKCCAGCCWCASADCCGYEITVEAPVGTVVGYVRQAQSCWAPKYHVYDASRTEVFTIQGPCCICQTICCTADVDFNISTADGKMDVGKISKQWAGFAKEVFVNADNFGITFPLDLDVKLKATLLGATILIDFMFFEESKNDN